MTDILDIWDELFEEAPSPAEEKLMRNLAQAVDPADTSFIVCAIVVRFLTQTLLLDPSSPVNLTGRIGKALQSLSLRARYLDDHLVQFDDRLKRMSGHAFLVNEALRNAQKFAEEQQKKAKPKFVIDPDCDLPYWEHTLAPHVLRSFGIRACLGSFAGTLLAGVLLVWIL